MRVMVDSNVIVSSLVFRSASMGKIIARISEQYELCIATCCLDEVREVMRAKFIAPDEALDEFFADVTHTVIQTPSELGTPLFEIRDAKDYPILHTAIIGQIDIFVTGDKDFFDVKVDRPEILAPLDFLAKY